MSFQQKFLVEFVVLTFGVFLAMLFPSFGFQVGIAAFAAARFYTTGTEADYKSTNWLVAATAMALILQGTGLDLFGVCARLDDGPRNIHIYALWAFMVWRLRKRYHLTSPPIV